MAQYLHTHTQDRRLNIFLRHILRRLTRRATYPQLYASLAGKALKCLFCKGFLRLLECGRLRPPLNPFKK